MEINLNLLIFALIREYTYKYILYTQVRVKINERKELKTNACC